MNKRLIMITCFFTFSLLALFQIANTPDKHVKTEHVFSNAIVKHGASGSDVLELQGRLKFLGFYNGDIDGKFGSKTLKSVKWFQSEFGLKTDGIVGAKTKLKLWEATKTWRPTDQTNTAANQGDQTVQPQAETTPDVLPASHKGLSANDIKLMANAVYGEARGEPYIGQVAVAAVILNRVESKLFPNTASAVIFQPGAFTAVADGQIWLEPNDTAKRAVMDALNGMDPTGNCIYYFNPDTATSAWIWSRPQVKKIGKHIFCK